MKPSKLLKSRRRSRERGSSEPLKTYAHKLAMQGDEVARAWFANKRGR